MTSGGDLDNSAHEERTVAQAFYNALVRDGLDILHEPERLRDALLAEAPDHPAMAVLRYNLDAELLAPYLEALGGNERPTEEELREAASHAETLLAEHRAIMQDAAHLATTQLSDGLATYLNVSATQPEDDAAEQKAWYRKFKRPPARIVLALLAVILLTVGVVYSVAHATITFDGNGGAGSVEPINTWKGSTFELPANAYSYTRHRFAGWSTSSNSIHPYKEKSTVTCDGSTTYYAIWKPCISFDGNGADDGSMEDLYVYDNTAIRLPACDFQRTGYSFRGWEDEQNGQVYGAGETVEVNGQVTYLATWRARAYFKGNGATSGSMDAIDAGESGAIKLPTCKYKRTNHVFRGWATNPDADPDDTYAEGKTYTLDTTKTFYAIWELDPKITDKLAIEPLGIDWNSGGHTTVLYVTNNASIPLKLQGSFTFKDAQGNTISSKTDTRQAVAPGERTMLRRKCEDTSWATTDYDVSAFDVESGHSPLYGFVSVKEQSLKEQSVTIRITNNGDTKAYIKRVIFHSDSSNGAKSMHSSDPEESIEPGEHIDVTFESTLAPGETDWKKFELREYFLDGYMKD